MRSAEPPGVLWLNADACEVSEFARAQVGEADVVAAVTGDDEDNLVISLLAKQEFAVPRVVARINNPKNEWMFNEMWGVDVSVSTPHLLTALVEEAVSVGTFVRLLSFEGGRARLVEVTLADDSPAADHEIAAARASPATRRSSPSSATTTSWCPGATRRCWPATRCSSSSPRAARKPCAAPHQELTGLLLAAAGCRRGSGAGGGRPRRRPRPRARSPAPGPMPAMRRRPVNTATARPLPSPTVTSSDGLPARGTTWMAATSPQMRAGVRGWVSTIRLTSTSQNRSCNRTWLTSSVVAFSRRNVSLMPMRTPTYKSGERSAAAAERHTRFRGFSRGGAGGGRGRK